ncbi:MAG: hypothetical protein ACFBSC_04065 [Microcoleaceae cyanobacterium]
MMLTGRVDRSDNRDEDRVQLIVEAIELVEKYVGLEASNSSEPVAPAVTQPAPRPIQAVRFKLSPEKLQEAQTLHRLKTVLSEYSGNPNSVRIPVDVMVVGQYHYQVVRLHPQFWVEDSTAILQRFQSSGLEAEIIYA